MLIAAWMQRGTELAACTRSIDASALMKIFGSAAPGPPLCLLSKPGDAGFRLASVAFEV